MRVGHEVLVGLRVLVGLGVRVGLLVGFGVRVAEGDGLGVTVGRSVRVTVSVGGTAVSIDAMAVSVGSFRAEIVREVADTALATASLQPYRARTGNVSFPPGGNSSSLFSRQLP